MKTKDLVAVIGEIVDNKKAVVANTKFGRGLVALENIKKGETIAEFEGSIFTARLASLLPNVPPLFIQDHAVQFSDTQYRWSKFGTALNHSCDPNCGINGAGAEFRIVAMKPIEKGEELTYDYEMTEDSDWRMKCECGTPICRKEIGAYANMPEQIREKYRGYVADYLVKKYGGY